MIESKYDLLYTVLLLCREEKNETATTIANSIVTQYQSFISMLQKKIILSYRLYTVYTHIQTLLPPVLDNNCLFLSLPLIPFSSCHAKLQKWKNTRENNYKQTLTFDCESKTECYAHTYTEREREARSRTAVAQCGWRKSRDVTESLILALDFIQL